MPTRFFFRLDMAHYRSSPTPPPLAVVPLLLADLITRHLCLACSAHRACAAASSLMLAAPRAAPKSTAQYPVPLRILVKHYQHYLGMVLVGAQQGLAGGLQA